MDYLRKIDVLGPSHSFQIEGKSSLKTFQGAVLSFLIFSLSALGAWFFGEKLIGAELTSTTSAKRYNGSPAPKTNEDLDFAFYFGIQDYEARHIYRPDLLDVSFNLRTLNKDFSGSNVKIPTHPCESADFHDHAEIFEKSVSFKNTYCIKASDTHKFALNSTFGYDDFKFLMISVEPCNNSTSAVSCAPQEEIDSFMEGFSFDFGFVKDVIDPTNYSEPATKEFNDFFGSASKNYRKEISFFFKHISIKSDIGWVFENIEKKNYLNVGQIKENFDLRPKKDCLVVIIRLDKEEEVITRKYYKLQDFLAQIGGVIKVLLLLGKYLYFPLSEKKLVVEAMRKEVLMGNYLSESKSATSAMPIAKKTITKFASTHRNLTNWDLISISLLCSKPKVAGQFNNISFRYKELLDIRTYLNNMSKLEVLSMNNKN